MIKLGVPLLFVLAGCTSIELGTPVAYPSACNYDKECLRNLDAQTLHYLGHTGAATRLMCAKPELKEVLGERCSEESLQSGSLPPFSPTLY